MDSIAWLFIRQEIAGAGFGPNASSLVFGVSHSHRGLSPVVSTSFRYEEPFERFSFKVWVKAVETAAWVAQGLPITGLKPQCE